jgi:Cu(I)/Ag(I) efflux system membrane fusion protein
VVNVSVGAEQDGRTAILSGLTEGQSIVVSGQFLIDSEASLKSTVNRLQTAAVPTATDPRSPSSQERTGSAMPASHLTRGTITAITPEAITIAHEPVPSLQWPAMTMGFKPPAQGVPKDLKVGDRVSFSFAAREGGSFQLESIAALDQSAAPGQPR